LPLRAGNLASIALQSLLNARRESFQIMTKSAQAYAKGQAGKASQNKILSSMSTRSFFAASERTFAAIRMLPNMIQAVIMPAM